MQHPLRKPTSKAPSAEAQAAVELKQRLTQYSSRWDVQAVLKGTTDAAAPLQAAKGLVALMAQLQQQRGACRRAEVRQHCAKQLSAALLLALLSSSSRETVTYTLQALQDYSRLFPGLCPVEVAGQLLKLLATVHHGVAAAKLLIEQLSHWRISQLLPEWVAHNTTQHIHDQIQQHLHPSPAAAAGSSAGFSSGSSSSSRGLEVCSSYLALLARVTALAEQQVVPDLAGTAAAAAKWLQLIAISCHPQQQRQWNVTVNLLLHSQLLDSGYQLLAAVMQTAAAAAALRVDQGLLMKLLEVLHRELQRPCDVPESHEQTILRWAHAAEAAAVPVLWQPAAAAGTRTSHSKLLTDITVSALETFKYLARSCGYSNMSLKPDRKVYEAALRILAAAAVPTAAAYGSKCSPVSQFMPALISSNSSRVLLHALALTVEGAHGVAAATVANNSSSSSSSSSACTTSAAPGQSTLLLEVPDPAAAAAGDQGFLAWMVLRHICSQCATMSPLPAAAAAVQPQIAHQTVQAYAALAHSNTPPTAAKLLAKLQLQLCQAAVAVAAQQEPHQQQQQQHADSQRVSRPRSATENSSSTSSSDAEGSTDRGANVQQQQQQESQLLSLQQVIQKMAASWQPLASLVLPRGVSNSSSNSSGSSPLGLGWQLIASSYTALSVAEAVHDVGSLAPPATAEIGVVLSACQIAAAVLKVLLPALLASSSSADKCQTHKIEAAGGADSTIQQQQQQKPQQKAGSKPVRLCGILECSLAAMQALMQLSKFIKAHLPSILACIGGSSSSRSMAAAAVTAAEAAMRDLQHALDDQLRQLLSRVMSDQPSSTPFGPAQHSSVNSGNDNTGAAAAATNIEALLLQQLQQELRCWAAAALATCYGQLGSSSSSSQGPMLAAARQPGSEFTDALLLLPGDQQQQQEELPIHAAVVASGCPVLGKQLSAAAAAAAGASAWQHLKIRLKASVDPVALQHALDCIYTGAATVSNAGLAAQMALAAAAVAHTGGSTQEQQHLCTNAAVQSLQQMQEQGQAELLALSRLSKKLQLPLLATLCKHPLPQPGQQLLPLHPQLDALLPQKVLIAPVPTQQQQQQQQQGEGVAATAEGLPVGRKHALSSSGSSMDTAVEAGMHNTYTFGDAAFGGQPVYTNGNDEGRTGLGCHPSCQSYLDAVSDFDCSAPVACSLPPVDHHDQLQHHHQQHTATSDPGWQFADVALAAPATVEQQMRTALLPAHKVLLSGRCQYFEALFSERWGPASYDPWGHTRRDDRQDLVVHGDHSGRDLAHTNPADHDDHAYDQDHAVRNNHVGDHDHQGHADHQDHPDHDDHDGAFLEMSQNPRQYPVGCSQQRQPHQDYSTCISTGGKASSAQAGIKPVADLLQQQQQQQQQYLRVVVVPQADIHVAAALQHWLYTGELKVELPAQLLVCSQQQQQQQEQQHHGHCSGCCCNDISMPVSHDHTEMCTQLCGSSSSSSSSCQIQLSGCCQACHVARTLLRLWRCADLLLLPDLQQHCAAAVEASARQQLSCGCCLQLLSDCVDLGVAAVAVGVIAGLVERFDKDTATACPEWAGLTAALQDVLARGWSSKQHQANETNHPDRRRGSEGLGTLVYARPGAYPGGCVLPAASGGSWSLSAMVHRDSVLRDAQSCVVAVPESCVAGVADAVKSFATVLNSIL